MNKVYLFTSKEDSGTKQYCKEHHNVTVEICLSLQPTLRVETESPLSVALFCRWITWQFLSSQSVRLYFVHYKLGCLCFHVCSSNERLKNSAAFFCLIWSLLRHMLDERSFSRSAAIIDISKHFCLNRWVSRVTIKNQRDVKLIIFFCYVTEGDMEVC
jgi:hypothetical protein